MRIGTAYGADHWRQLNQPVRCKSCCQCWKRIRRFCQPEPLVLLWEFAAVNFRLQYAFVDMSRDSLVVQDHARGADGDLGRFKAAGISIPHRNVTCMCGLADAVSVRLLIAALTATSPAVRQRAAVPRGRSAWQYNGC